MENTTAAEACADRCEISELLARYAHAIDGRDWELLGTCFAPDAVLEYESLGPLPGGYEEFEATARSMTSGTGLTQHLIGSIQVSVSGDQAKARSYVLATQVTSDGDISLTGGCYMDELIKANDGWRISHRKAFPRWTQGKSH
jgi:ketosteroid isomerase-like protein